MFLTTVLICDQLRDKLIYILPNSRAFLTYSTAFRNSLFCTNYVNNTTKFIRNSMH